jgi:outer membrane protein, heavy metal efflux system
MVGKFVFIFIAVLVSGCASLPEKPGFDGVKTLVGARVPQEIAWRQTEQERLNVQAQVTDQLKSPLLLDAALRIALINNPRLQASYEKLGMDYGDLVQAGLPANPSLSLAITSSAVGAGREFGIVQDFLSWLTLAPRRRLSAAQFEETKLNTAAQVLQLSSDVKRAYFTLIADQQALDLVADVATASTVAADLAQRQFEAGNIGIRELALRQESQARSTLDVSRQELALAQSREHLSALMGLSSDQRNWQPSNVQLDTADEIPDLKKLEISALGDRYDMAAAKKRAARLADALGVANRFRYLGVLGLGVSYARETDGERLRGPNIELGLPLWDRGQGNRLHMQSALRESERDLEALALDVIGEVRHAHGRLDNARRAMQHFRSTLLPLHERIVAETLKFYNGMLLGVYDVLLARQNQFNAQRDYIETLKSYWLAKTELEHALGGISLGINATPQQPEMKSDTPPADHKHH